MIPFAKAGKEGTSPLKKKGKMARPRSPGADRSPRFQTGREEGERFFPHPPPFLSEGFSEEEFPGLSPWVDEAPPPLHFRRERREQGENPRFQDPWVMEVPFLEEWKAFFPRDEEGEREERRKGDFPKSYGEWGLFPPRDPLPRKKRSVGPMESVEKLSPSLDETEVLDKIRTRSRFRGKGKRSAKG
jgi:hypothetical protein